MNTQLPTHNFTGMPNGHTEKNVSEWKWSPILVLSGFLSACGNLIPPVSQSKNLTIIHFSHIPHIKSSVNPISSSFNICQEWDDFLLLPTLFVPQSGGSQMLASISVCWKARYNTGFWAPPTSKVSNSKSLGWDLSNVHVAPENTPENDHPVLSHQYLLPRLFHRLLSGFPFSTLIPLRFSSNKCHRWSVLNQSQIMSLLFLKFPHGSHLTKRGI